jgi:methionyl-tRNA formyltransferase
MMVEVLADLPAFEPLPQPEDGVTYAAKIRKEETRIDWSRPVTELVRHVQGLAPFPGAWFEVNSERIKVLAAEVELNLRHPRESGDPASLQEEQRDPRLRGGDGLVLDDGLLIACGNGALRPTLVQRAGKGAMSPSELLRGFAIPKGSILP